MSSAVSEITTDINSKFAVLGEMVSKSINASQNLEKEFTKQATQNKEEIMSMMKTLIEQ